MIARTKALSITLGEMNGWTLMSIKAALMVEALPAPYERTLIWIMAERGELWKVRPTRTEGNCR
jgi:hypothetical protein